MRAVLKSRLVARFDRAIDDAKEGGLDIICFQLESKEENEHIEAYMKNTGLNVTLASLCEYEGIPVKWYEEAK